MKNLKIVCLFLLLSICCINLLFGKFEIGSNTVKQLIIIADMEGASGIFERNYSWVFNRQPDWREYGRDAITSDVLAVCNAAIEFGIDDILLYDMHYAGNPDFNVILEKLPSIVRIFDVPNRQFIWRRIRGQAKLEPFGLITVGFHARCNEPNAYLPHTIESPPIKNIMINGVHISCLGNAVLSFYGVPFLANIGCQASMLEARELSEKVVTIPVKDKEKKWEPSYKETYQLIYDGTLRALNQANMVNVTEFEPPYLFSMELWDGFEFDTNVKISWAGTVTPKKAEWTAPNIEMGVEIVDYIRELIKR